MDDHLVGLSGSELTSTLLTEMRRRSRTMSASTVKRRFENDRFTRTSIADPASIRRLETILAAHFPPGTEEMALSPLAPFGAHAAVAGVDQNRVVSTIRGNEVAADPTVVLAVEASRRRSSLLVDDPTSTELVCLAAFQRVTRAQQFEGKRSFAHFQLAGMVSAGRDTGNEGFERTAISLHVAHIAEALTAIGCERIEILVTDFTGGKLGSVMEAVAASTATNTVAVVAFPDRTRARNYYTDCAIEVRVEIAGEWVEVGDGGMVDWSQRLVASRKERMMTSGVSVERLALVLE